MKRIALPSVPLVCAIALTLLAGCPTGDPQPGQSRTFNGIKFQWCPPGTFAMGSPAMETGRNDDETLHTVNITKGFWMSTTEITQAQWKSLIATNPSFYTGNNNPVDGVSWDGTQDFLVLFNAASDDGGTYRLPTEAEWEYAYRADTVTRYYWGDDPSSIAINANAWYKNNCNDVTHRVGTKSANDWGLRDMSGNVSEWCQDFYGAYPTLPVTDPTGPATGTTRVFRGGELFSLAKNCRAATRNQNVPNDNAGNSGFRIVREAD